MSHKDITGFDTPEEFFAYESGRIHKEKMIIDFIKKWNGNTNSELGFILNKKFKEVKDKI